MNIHNDSARNNKDKDTTRLDEAIRARQVRVIVESTNEQLGILNIDEALSKARSLGLNLVEVQPGGEYPVCKIMDYGKFKFEQSKRKKDAKKNSKVVVLKELYVHLSIAEHDYQVKLNQTKKFLSKGFKVKLVVKLLGREANRSEHAIALLYRFDSDLGGDLQVKKDISPKIDGQNPKYTNAIVIFAPKKEGYPAVKDEMLEKSMENIDDGDISDDHVE